VTVNNTYKFNPDSLPCLPVFARLPEDLKSDNLLMVDFLNVCLYKGATFWNDRNIAGTSAATAAVITLFAASKPGFAGVFALAVVANNI
jgi:hypothetical protein